MTALAAVLLTGCGPKQAASAPLPGPAATAAALRRASATGRVPDYTFEVAHVWPHDREAFTEGLIYMKGVLFESTGLNGASTLRRVDLTTGRVLQETRLDPRYFGEGMTILGNRIYQLTWRSHTGFVYDADTFAVRRTFSYDGEGWGLTTDGEALIMSDGTNRLRFLDPETFRVRRTVAVLAGGVPVEAINELEYVKGEIYANIWQTPLVIRIDPATGRLLGTIDFSGLLAPSDYGPNTDVLNGIAYDAAGDRLFVTGKNWPKLFEVRLRPRSR